MNEIRKILGEIDYYIVISKESEEDVFVSFKTYQIVGRTFEPEVIHYFYLKDYKSSDDITTNINEAQIYASGTLKWDGCMDMQFDEQENVQLHFCSKQDAKGVGILLSSIYEESITLIPQLKEYINK